MGDWIVCAVQRHGHQQDIERKMTYISSMNQFIAERHLSAAELTDPALKREEVYLSFQDDHNTGPRIWKNLAYHIRNGWVCSTVSRSQELMGETVSTGMRN